MRKHYVLILALVLLLAFAGAASAEQLREPIDNPSPGGPFFTYSQTPKQFDASGATNQYPYGIYLPNAAAPSAYRIHSQYQKNTDACASCHATHTAVGPSLLQWTSIYATCMACHDGTVTTTYNVKDGKIGGTEQLTNGGLFSTVLTGEDGKSTSMHNVSGNVNIFAAPGGNPNPLGGDGDWNASFSCSSCHNPHGTGGNARILHPNPNRVNTQKNDVSVSVTDAVYYYLPDYALRGFGYNFTVKQGSTVIDGDKYQVDFDHTRQVTAVKWLDGANGPASLNFTYTPSLRVTMEISNYLASGGDEEVKYVSGINNFCGACHRDYNGGKGSHMSPTGFYTQAYRHPVGLLGTFNWYVPENSGLKFGTAGGNREILCLTCHFAHGTDKAYWGKYTTALSNPSWDGLENKEMSGSSSLKRLPNMATCEACHQMGPANIGYSNTETASVISENDFLALSGTQTLTTGFVGAETCGNCHAGHYNRQKEHLHTKKARPASQVPWWKPGNPVYDQYQQRVDAYRAQVSAGTLTAAGVGNNHTGFLSVGDGADNTLRTYLVDAADVEFIYGDKWKIRFGIRYSSLPENIRNIANWGTKTSGSNTIPFPKEGVIFIRSQFNTMFRGNDAGTPGDTIVGSNALLNAPSSNWGGHNPATVWQLECIGCHTTGFNLADYNADKNAWPKDPVTGEMNHIADYGVTCEACHGPGANHAGFPTKTNIKNPARFDINRQNDLCGACHARNSRLTSVASDAPIKRQDPIPTVMMPGDTLLNHVVVNTASMNNFRGTQHRMQWQELLHVMQGDTVATLESPLSGDAKRSAKSKIVSCSTCHDSHGYTADGYSLKLTMVKTCEACHGAAYNTLQKVNDNMPYGVASGGMPDIRYHLFPFTKTTR